MLHIQELLLSIMCMNDDQDYRKIGYSSETQYKRRYYDVSRPTNDFIATLSMNYAQSQNQTDLMIGFEWKDIYDI